jgi:hypothetical protein
MGLLGPDIRKIDGENYSKEGDFEDQGEAKTWAASYKAYGYKARVIPNAHHRRFEVWVSEFPSEAAQNLVPKV